MNGAQDVTVRSSIDTPEVVWHDVKHTNYFETGDICYRSVVCMYVCVSSAKAVGRNEMLFSRDT